MEPGIAPQAIETVGVIGAGTMGHGIAQVAATAGYKVLLRDVDLDSLSRGIQAIERNLAKGMQLGKLTEADCDSTLQHIRGTTHLEEIAVADLVIEAAPERLELSAHEGGGRYPGPATSSSRRAISMRRRSVR